MNTSSEQEPLAPDAKFDEIKPERTGPVLDIAFDLHRGLVRAYFNIRESYFNVRTAALRGYDGWADKKIEDLQGKIADARAKYETEDHD